MAKADHIKALVRSHAEGDDARFYAVAMQVAAQAARSGHGRLATELRELVDEARERASTLERGRGIAPTPLARPKGELAGLLSVSYPEVRLSDLVLDSPASETLERIVVEQRQRERLHQHGFEPVRKVLLAGPPGTGKTMSAAALAGELGLPLLTIQLDGLITKFMGETAAKLRLVFDAMRQTRGVYLFDEFDALGGERAATNDVGEIRRVVNSFLQLLDDLDEDSLVIAATNHLQLLDAALFRRFDVLLQYDLPDPETAVQVMRQRLSGLDVEKVDWPLVGQATVGLSHGDVVRACEQAAKDVILSGVAVIDTRGLERALLARHSVGHGRTE